MYSQCRRANGSLWALISLILTTGGCDATFGPSLRGSGIPKTETRAVEPFSEIEVASAIQLDVAVGPANELVVVTDDNLLPYVRTVVSNGRLRIYADSSYSSDLGIRVTAAAPTIRALAAGGAARVTISDVAEDEFELELSGASNCHLNGDAERMDVTLSGASHGMIVGTAEHVEIECSGASRLAATGLVAKKVVADLSGASVANVHATEELIGDASGASTLHYAGQPAKLDQNTSGASTIAAE